MNAINDLSGISNKILNESVMFEIGTKTLLIIKQRTLKGIFLDGSSPGSEHYSRKPAGMPLGAFQAKVGKGQKLWKQLVDADEASIYSNVKSRKTWIILKRGYEQLRQVTGRETDRVTLNWSGTMMQSLKVTNHTANSFTIGFTDAESQARARYLQMLGAGKNKVKRVFVALSPEELNTISQDIHSRINFNL